MQPTPPPPRPGLVPTSGVSSPVASPPSAGLSAVAQALKHSAQAPLPSFDFPNTAVKAPQYVAAGTGLYTALGYLVVAVGAITLLLVSSGLIIPIYLVGALIGWFQMRKVRAHIRGSGVQVGPQQLPQLHAMVTDFSRRLGLSAVPEVYIVEENVQNGFAVKLGKKNLILLTDDMVWGALQSRDPRALGFVVGHELAHIALGHTGVVRSTLRTTFRPLSRADELSSDNVAARLVGSASIAIHGLALLTVGPQLLPYINEEALLQQARDVCADGLTKKAERTLTHPLLMRRIGNLQE